VFDAAARRRSLTLTCEAVRGIELPAPAAAASGAA
jgi:hypothetical protein